MRICRDRQLNTVAEPLQTARLSSSEGKEEGHEGFAASALRLWYLACIDLLAICLLDSGTNPSTNSV